MRTLLSLILCIVSTSCSSQNNQSIESRIVSLHPSITQTIFHLGKGSSLYGRSDYCSTPLEASTLPNFGSSLTPNYEKIAASGITDILITGEISEKDAPLSELAKIHSHPWLTIDEMKQSVIKIGQRFDVSERSDKLIVQLDEVFTKPESEAPSVLMLMMSSEIANGQIWYLKSNSIHGSIIEAAGFNNGAPGTDNAPVMSVEQLLKINPDIIVLLGSTETTKESTSKRETVMAIQGLAAAKNEQVFTLTDENAFGTGPNILRLVTLLRNLLETNSNASD